MATTLSAIVTRRSFWRGAVAIVAFLILWEIGSLSKTWMAPEFFAPLKNVLGMLGFKKDYLPWIGAVPAPSAVLVSWAHVVGEKGYWHSWYMSFFRVMGGFISAMVVGIPVGLMLAVSRYTRWVAFPVFEVLRPIPPLAWVPASIIFWPTQELVDHVHHVSRRVLHDRHQRAPARSTAYLGGALDGIEPVRHLLADHLPARCRRSSSARRSAWASPGKSSLPRR